LESSWLLSMRIKSRAPLQKIPVSASDYYSALYFSSYGTSICPLSTRYIFLSVVLLSSLISLRLSFFSRDPGRRRNSHNSILRVRRSSLFGFYAVPSSPRNCVDHVPGSRLFFSFSALVILSVVQSKAACLPFPLLYTVTLSFLELRRIAVVCP